jgi:type VI secretion system protein ImpK
MTALTSPARRAENLALIYQEVLTAIVRLHSTRQSVSDPNAFRHHTREALNAAGRQALAVGYDADDIKCATFAAVAFLDESVLNSKNPIFADWLKKPLQEELFGTHVAGDVFFQNLQHLLGRTDSMDLADLLEIHYLCLLLGFGGRYSANRGELKQIRELAAEKIRRARGRMGALAPASVLPDERISSGKEPWGRRLAIASIVCALILVTLFVWYKTSLTTEMSEIGGIALQAGR